MTGIGAVLLLAALLFVRNYEDFVPNLLIPFLPTTTRLDPSLSDKQQPLLHSAEQPMGIIMARSVRSFIASFVFST